MTATQEQSLLEDIAIELSDLQPEVRSRSLLVREIKVSIDNQRRVRIEPTWFQRRRRTLTLKVLNPSHIAAKVRGILTNREEDNKRAQEHEAARQVYLNQLAAAKMRMEEAVTKTTKHHGLMKVREWDAVPDPAGVLRFDLELGSLTETQALSILEIVNSLTEVELDVLAEVFEDFVRVLVNGEDGIPATKLAVIHKAIALRDRLFAAHKDNSAPLCARHEIPCERCDWICPACIQEQQQGAGR